MIEVIQDGREHEVLIYTNDTPTAVKLRKAFEADGAVYSGKPMGYSWRVKKGVAIITLKKFGLKYELQRHIEKQEVTETENVNIAQERSEFPCRPNDTRGNRSRSQSIFG